MNPLMITAAVILSLLTVLGLAQLPEPEQLRSTEQLQVQANLHSALNVAETQLQQRSGPCRTELHFGSGGAATTDVWWPDGCPAPAGVTTTEGARITVTSGDQTIKRTIP